MSGAPLAPGAVEHPTPEAMVIEAWPYQSDDPGQPEAMADRAKRRNAVRGVYAMGIAHERARLTAILRDLDKGDWLPGRLRALVASLEGQPEPVLGSSAKRIWPAPAEVARYQAHREDGSPIYTGTIVPSPGPYSTSRCEGGSIEDQLAFHVKGHPACYGVVIVERYRYVGSEEVPVDRSPEALDTWHERNRRSRT